jgi:hypothetical protein
VPKQRESAANTTAEASVPVPASSQTEETTAQAPAQAQSTPAASPAKAAPAGERKTLPPIKSSTPAGSKK